MKIKRKIRKIRKKIRKLLVINYYVSCHKNKKIKPNFVLIESKHGKDIAGNMFYLLREINENYIDKKVYIVCTNKDKFKIKELLKYYNIKDFGFVKKNSLKYYKYLALSKYIFTDTSLAGLYIKKDDQIFVNTWHGTPLKLMGKKEKSKKYSIANVQKNHILANYLIYPSEYMKDIMDEAYMIDNFYNGEYLMEGYPRNSIFFDLERASQLREELQLGDKKVYVYMPTWRGILNKQRDQEQIERLKQYFTEIDNQLNDDQILYVKLHVFVKENIDLLNYKHIKEMPKYIETYDFLNMADCLITDYSSVFFDFANTRRKIILFTYDLEDYLQERGLYFNLKSLPFPIVGDVNSLVKELNTARNYDDTKFLEKFCSYDNKNATKNICEKIFSDKIKEQNTRKDKKEKVLIYISTIAKNGLTTALINLLETIDTDKRDYVLTFYDNIKTRESEEFKILSEKFEYIPIDAGLPYSFFEMIAAILFYKFNIKSKTIELLLDRLYKRKIDKHFKDIKFDFVINYSGYNSKFISTFQRFDAKKIIFVHNIMSNEMKFKNNQHKLTLIGAYQNYDFVIGVSEDVTRDVGQISGKKDNTFVINNLMNYNKIVDKSKGPVEYDEYTESNVSIEKLKEVLNTNGIKFINIGRFSVEKGHFRLIDAFVKFNSEINENSFLIIIGGYGNLYSKTLEYVKQQKCSDKIIIIKNVSNPISILKKCDLFILSLHYEGQGLVLFESMISGVRCISTDVPGARDVLKKFPENLVTDNFEGIYDGMVRFSEGDIKHIEMDFDKYNNEQIEKFEELFN